MHTRLRIGAECVNSARRRPKTAAPEVLTAQYESVKIAILAESFLPHMNGVTGSVLQVVKHLRARGHDPLILAPDAGPIDRDPHANPHGVDLRDARIVRLPAVSLPSYPEVRIATVSANRITHALRASGAEAVHLASPFVLGWAGVRAADALGLPSVAVYQTDVASYTEKYGLAATSAIAEGHIARLHRRATLTLAPSSSAHTFLESLGVDRLRGWGRGVDADRFAPEHRDERWRRDVAEGEVIVGYVGRLSPEKQVEDLLAVHELPGVRLVIVGDGPSRAELERLLPRAHFTGFQGGTDLARIVASFDVFVHPGESETFCQTVQEALASGVPVVATGSGGPLDLVKSSVNGWLYRPGDLEELRGRVVDLTGDPSKRTAFSQAARLSVRDRSWSALGDQLLGHYEEAAELRRIDSAMVVRPTVRPRSEPLPQEPAAPTRFLRYVALGDSITEGLGDTSRMAEGECLGWAARLAMLLAGGQGEDRGIEFANLAVRSRRVRHLPEQVSQALDLMPDFVSILAGANDLVRSRLDIPVALRTLEAEVVGLRAIGVEVLLGTPFLPRRALARVLTRRFAEFNAGVRGIALRHDCRLLDTDTIPEIGDLDMWAEDRVHLNSAGHRLLAYRAAESMGVPDALQLRGLEHSLHDDTEADLMGGVSWFRAHALPWAWRRVRGRTAGDGLSAKHSAYIELSAAGIDNSRTR